MMRLYTRTKRSGIPDINYAVLEKKWRLFYRFLDFDKDQCINEDDIGRMCQNINQVYNLPPAKRKEIRQALKAWWQVFKMHMGSARLLSCEDEFVATIKLLFQQDNRELQNRVKDLVDAMIILMDVSGEVVITRSKYVRMFCVMGATNGCYAGRVFDRLNADGSGILTKAKFRLAIHRFFFDDKEQNSMKYIFDFPVP